MTVDTQKPGDRQKLSRAESDEIARRRRARNWAMLVVLALVAALFYAITLAKLGKF
jgi:nicotinamide riboside transporter PnuC